MNNKREYLTGKIRELYSIVQELERECPDRRFTLDGHLIGSIAEVLAAEHYGLKLLPVGTKTHDAEAKDGRRVQIKATQTDRIGISSKPEYLIVIKIDRDGDWEEIYNGPGEEVWKRIDETKPSKNGQWQISLAKLRAMMQSVTEEQKI